MVGGLNKVVVFRQNTPSQQGAGYVDSYSDLLTTRGALRSLSSSRGFSFGEVLQTNTHELIVRYQTALASGLRGDMKVVIDGRTFTVSTWEKIGEKKFYYKLIINEQKD